MAMPLSGGQPPAEWDLETAAASPARRSRRGARAALAALALAAVVGALTQAPRHGSDGRDQAGDHRRPEPGVSVPAPVDGRQSSGLDSGPAPTSTTAPTPVAKRPAGPAGPAASAVPGSILPPAGLTTAGASGPAGAGGTGPGATPSAGTSGPVSATVHLPRPTPGLPTQVGPPSPPVLTSPSSTVPPSPPVDEVRWSAPPTTTTEPPPPPPPPPPDRDEENCPNLDLYPIGGVTSDAPPELQALAPRFRELAAVELAKPLLVCAKPLEIWRDLVIQRLVTGGQADGALITAYDGSSIVLRIDEIEWTGYRFRYNGSPVGVNFLGYPVDRETRDGARIIHTTKGGLVSARADTIGVPVVGGAWDYWIGQGGPTGPLGMPVGNPTGIVGVGAHQDFANGWIALPGVTTDVEAAAQPADRYVWHPRSEYLDPPPDGIGKILQTTGMAFYVDPGGTRHWLRTTADWSCARWNLQAPEIPVRGFVLAQYPLGSQFTCPG